MLIYHY